MTKLTFLASNARFWAIDGTTKYVKNPNEPANTDQLFVSNICWRVLASESDPVKVHPGAEPAMNPEAPVSTDCLCEGVAFDATMAGIL